MTFLSDDQALMHEVRDFFRARVSLRGFHELFKAIKKIGKGSFASVYLAERLEDKKMMAVKAFSKEALREDEKGMAPLINEINIIRQLNHSNIMHLYEVYESDNSIYMIVELIQHGQLYSKIQARYSFTAKEIKTIMGGILSGLEYMARKDIIHRDLKPENILFHDSTYEVVICDFGLATFAHEPEYIYVRCGTPGYVAPEIVNIKDMKTHSEPISDVFSAGLIFHILLFGKSIFKGKNYNEVLSENRVCAFKLEGPPYSSLSDVALDLLTKMLKKNPSARISAAHALRHPFFHKDDMEPKHEKPVSVDSPGPKFPDKATKDKLTQDSCAKFVMGKDGGFNGKIVSVGEVDSQKDMDSPGMVKNIGQQRKAPEKSRFNKYSEANSDDE